MPLTVECPSCGSRMTAPDKLAGKTVRCPKCATAFGVPLPDAGFEVVEDDEPVVAKPRVKPQAPEPGFEVVEDEEPVVAKPRKKPRPSVVEADDEDDDDRTLRKKKKPKKGLSPVLLYGSIASVVLLVGVGVGIYFLTTGGKGGGGGVIGPSWSKFDAPDGSFSTSFPEGPPSSEDILALMTRTDPQTGNQLRQVLSQTGMTVQGWSRDTGRKKYILGVMTLPANAAGMFSEDQMLQQMVSQGKAASGRGGESVLGERDLSVSGRKAKQLLSKRAGEFGLTTFTVANNRVYLFVVQSKDELQLTDSTTSEFLSKFELKK
jgi:hypothetical protein